MSDGSNNGDRPQADWAAKSAAFWKAAVEDGQEILRKRAARLGQAGGGGSDGGDHPPPTDEVRGDTETERKARAKQIVDAEEAQRERQRQFDQQVQLDRQRIVEQPPPQKTDPWLITDPVRREQLERERNADRDSEGRPLTVEQVARQLSPQLARADDALKTLEQDAATDKREHLRLQTWKQSLENAAMLRRGEIGVARFILHKTLSRNGELQQYEKQAKVVQKQIARIALRQHARPALVDAANMEFNERFAEVEPKARQKLAELQQTASQARDQLAQHTAAEREIQRERYRQSEKETPTPRHRLRM